MLNIFNKPLQLCSLQPLTGYRRDGFCTKFENDPGLHVVCAIIDNNFLQFTKSRGNDLMTPSSSFPGLKDGDKWCICLGRWLEAYRSGLAPKIDPHATTKQILDYVPLHELMLYFEK